MSKLQDAFTLDFEKGMLERQAGKERESSTVEYGVMKIKARPEKTENEPFKKRAVWLTEWVKEKFPETKKPDDWRVRPRKSVQIGSF